MPASRKRNKGKDRKAKQLAKKEEKDRANAHELWYSWVKVTECDHGCDMIISDDHPVSSFMDDFFVNVRHNRNKSFDFVVSETLRELFKSHVQVYGEMRDTEV